MFHSHNVRLPDGSETAPGRPLVRESSACVAAVNVLYQAFGRLTKGITIADLGCLEGGYSLEFARLGYEVYGIEAREENVANAYLLQDAFKLPNLHFVQGDVRGYLEGGQFDAIFCSGLLYHLDKPVAFLEELARATRKLLILNTHYSMGPGGHPESSHHAGYGCDYGDPFRPEGRRGHWCTEEDSRWAAFGNRKSFWLEKDEIFDVLRENGFATVNEVSDWWDHGSDYHVQGGPGRVPDRGMFTALKP